MLYIFTLSPPVFLLAPFCSRLLQWRSRGAAIHVIFATTRVTEVYGTQNTSAGPASVSATTSQEIVHPCLTEEMTAESNRAQPRDAHRRNLVRRHAHRECPQLRHGQETELHQPGHFPLLLPRQGGTMHTAQPRRGRPEQLTLRLTLTLWIIPRRCPSARLHWRRSEKGRRLQMKARPTRTACSRNGWKGF